MPDIFLSYSRDDQAIARRFAEGFEREGFSVWWDQTLDPGDAYDHVTEQALKEAKAVVVLWSKKSVASRWVRAEATLADRNKTLVPVMVEACERPIMFELTQTADLAGWAGDRSDPAWQAYVAGVRRFVERGTAHGTQPAAAVKGTPAGDARVGKPSRRRWALAAAALLLVAGTALYVWHRTATVAAPTVAQATATKPRIAILPFENLSPDPANAFFADGMHEEILSALSNSAPGLEVISRTTMMTYRTTPKPVAQIAKELGATYVLEGSVRRDGEDVRLTLQLIDAKTDAHVWSQNFNRKLVKAMTLQSEVAGAVASQLAVQLSPAAHAATAPPTKDPVAYDLYLQARLAARQINGGTSRAEAKRVYDLYSAAIAHDPDFGVAYLGRVSLGPNGIASTKVEMDAWVRQARQDVASARRILGNDPRVALFEAVNASGGPQRDVAKTLALFDAAEAQGLNDPEILILKTSILVAAGRMEEALSLEQRLVTLDPANTSALVAWGADCWMAKQPQQALRVTDLLIARLPDQLDEWTWFRNSLIYNFTGNNDALQRMEIKSAMPGVDPGLLVPLQLYVLRHQRRYDEIRRLLNRQPGPLMPETGMFQSYNLGLPPPPVAEMRGWANLLLNDRAAAKSDGLTTLRMLGQATEADPQLTWLSRLRVAEGQLFAGDNSKAANTAREGMALIPRSGNALQWLYAMNMATGVLAWAGQKDEAVTMLEQLADAIPGVSPAAIARDPIYTVALADNARFQALKARLEAQLAATKL